MDGHNTRPSNTTMVASMLILLLLLTMVTPSGGAQDIEVHFRGGDENTGVFDLDVPDNNGLLWTFTTEDQVQSSPSYYDKKVYFGSDDGGIYAVDATWGTEIWKVSTGESVMASPTISDEGVLYIGSSNHVFYALDAGTGDEIWRFPLPTGYGQIPSTATLDDANVYFGATDGIIYAINLTTHEQTWNFTTGGEIWSSPALWGDRLYVGSLDDNMYCLWKENGTKAWNFSTAAYEGIYSSPAVSNGKVVFGTGHDTKAFFALDAETGQVKWKFEASGPNYASPAIHDGTVFIPAWGPPGSLYALPLEDPSPGDGVMEEENIKWKAETHDEQGGSSVVYSKDRVLVGSDHGMGGDGRLFCFNATTGKQLWNFTTGGDVYSTPGLGKGTVYIGSNDGRVYAVGGDPNAKMEVQVMPEQDMVQGGRVIGVSFLVTFRGLPLEGAFIKMSVTDGELSQSGASTFPDGSQRVKYQAPNVRSETKITFTAEGTFFGLENSVSTANITVVPASKYQVRSTDTFNLKRYSLYIGLTIFLIVANVVVVVLTGKASKGTEVMKAQGRTKKGA